MLKKFSFLFIGLALASCGMAPAPASKAKSGTLAADLYIADFSPPANSNLPGAVVVTFNKKEINPSLVSVVSHYNLLCLGVNYAADNVYTDPSFAAVTVTLQYPVGLASGTECTLWVSPLIKDTSGNALSGVRFVTYKIP